MDAHFTKQAGVVFIKICSVVVLASSHTTTSRMFSVLSYTTMASGDVAAAAEKVRSVCEG